MATFQRLKQTAEIPPTTIYTPKNWGTFGISIVMVGTVATGNGYWAGELLFDDGAGKDNPFDFAAFLNTDIRRTGVAEFPFRAKTAKPIRFQVKSSGTAGSKYNAWVVVEQLM